MLRLAGAFLMVLGGGFWGIFTAKSQTAHLSHLRSLRAALEFIERELRFRLPPLGEIFLTLSCGKDETARFFSDCHKGLSGLGELRLSEIWERELRRAKFKLHGPEESILLEVGQVLGRYDGESQRAALTGAAEQLSIRISELQDIYKKKSRMYETLGVSAGALAAILLI